MDPRGCRFLAAASIGLAPAAADFWPSSEMVADLGHSLTAEVILGAGVWPYNLSLVSHELQSMPLIGFSNCDRGQCGIYGLASATFLDRRTNNADSKKVESVGLSSSHAPRALGPVPRRAFGSCSQSSPLPSRCSAFH
jgi:hypothetical protein